MHLIIAVRPLPDAVPLRTTQRPRPHSQQQGEMGRRWWRQWRSLLGLPV